jgi:prepilin-type N-terminal cleavage/methylation domain-containing protein
MLKSTKQNFLLFSSSSQKGFSLMEVLVATGLLGIAALAFMNLMEQSNKSAKELEERFVENEILGEIKSILSEPKSCTSSLNGKNALNISEGEVMAINDLSAGGAVIPRYLANAKGEGPGYGKVHKKILGYSLKSEVFNGAPPTDANGFEASSPSGTGVFMVHFYRGPKRPPYKARFRLRITTASATDRSIQSCRHAGAETITTQMLCDSMKGFQWDPVKNGCKLKPFKCDSTWIGNGSTSKWSGRIRYATCPAGCTAGNVELQYKHHSGGDEDTPALRIQCCCPDET